MLIPNEQQEKAIELGKKWFWERNKQVFEIAGYAGTGKSTLVNWILESCNIKPEESLNLAYVGKAVLVLQRKGVNAKTIHSAIYTPVEVLRTDKFGKPIVFDGRLQYTTKFVLRDKEELKKYKIIIVDEGSMVNKQLFDDLCSFGIPIVVLGDTYQLPPVFGKSPCLQNPDVLLTEIMRQNEGNPIIHFAELARTKKYNKFNYGTYGNVSILPEVKVLEDFNLLRNSDIILCGFNKTRYSLNYFMREKVYGYSENEIIVPGEKMICRKNNWRCNLDETIFLINGLIGYVKDINKESFTGKSICIDFAPEFMQKRIFMNIKIDYKYIQLHYAYKKNYFSYFNMFEYGYVITTHLAQGSQYNSVILFAERFGNSDDFSRWLYTGITRAIDKLVIAV